MSLNNIILCFSFYPLCGVDIISDFMNVVCDTLHKFIFLLLYKENNSLSLFLSYGSL
jgi:hypothetical protein